MKQDIKTKNQDLKSMRPHNIEAYLEISGKQLSKQEAQDIVVAYIKNKDYERYGGQFQRSALEEFLQIERFPEIEFKQMRNIIQEEYEYQLTNTAIEDAQTLSEITKIKPQLSQKTIDEVYEKICEKEERVWCIVRKLETLHSLIQKYPSQDVARKLFLRKSKQDHESTMELSRVLKYTPSTDNIQQVYNHIFENEIYEIPWFGCAIKNTLEYKLEHIKSHTNVDYKFDAQIVENMYNKIMNMTSDDFEKNNTLRHLDVYWEYYKLSRAKEIYEITRQRPSWSEKIVQGKYKQYMQEDMLYSLELITTLYYMTKIKIEADARTVQKYYKEILSEYPDEIENIRQAIGKGPSDKTIQQAYIHLFKQGEYAEIRKIQKITNVKPEMGL